MFMKCSNENCINIFDIDEQIIKTGLLGDYVFCDECNKLITEGIFENITIELPFYCNGNRKLK